MPHANLVPTRVEAGAPLQVRFELQDRKHAIFELELAMLNKVQHRRGRKGLADAGYAKQRSGANGFVLLQIGMAEAPGVDQTAVVGHRQSGAGRFVLAQEGRHQIVIGGQLRHDRPRDSTVNLLPTRPRGEPSGGGRAQELAPRRTRRHRTGKRQCHGLWGSKMGSNPSRGLSLSAARGQAQFTALKRPKIEPVPGRCLSFERFA